ncbi:hypothetical protein Tco_0021734, partial [Tanacetum coccineum]
LAAKAMDDVSRQAFKEEKRRIASQKKATQATSTNKLSTDRQSVSTDRPFVSTDRSNTPYVSAASTPTGANVGESSFVYLGGKIPIDASTLPNTDLPIDPNMHDLEDASDTLPNDGIFNRAYDDEDVGAMADFNNMDNTIVVSPIPTLKIHKDHPKGQILGDPTSTVQTRGKIQKASSAQQALEQDEEREAYVKDKVKDASSESEIGVDVIPTATKPPTIVNWKIIYQSSLKAAYQIIRKDGSDKIYMSFGAILKDFSRDELVVELYRLVIKKYGANRPEEMYDRVLWGDLKTMFDPPLSDDAIWSLPLQQKTIN